MIPVIVIVGPTAIGKSNLGIQLALRLQGEIISGDAMQVYKKMDIGTAKVTLEEQSLVPHHLIDVMDIHESYDVARFQRDVRSTIQSIHQRGHLPILVGGTGLYLKAALYDYGFQEESGEQLEIIRQRLVNLSTEELFHKLSEVDKESAQKIGPMNRRRLQRALEIYELTGTTKSSHEETQTHQPLYDIRWIGLTMNREALHQRQDSRIKKMIDQGLVQEVQRLFGPTYNSVSTSAQAIGYKELFPFLQGKLTLEEAVRSIEIHTHQYTKRQMTWFRHQVPVQWFEVDQKSSEEVLQSVLTWLNGPKEAQK